MFERQLVKLRVQWRRQVRKQILKLSDLILLCTYESLISVKPIFWVAAHDSLKATTAKLFVYEKNGRINGWQCFMETPACRYLMLISRATGILFRNCLPMPISCSVESTFSCHFKVLHQGLWSIWNSFFVEGERKGCSSFFSRACSLLSVLFLEKAVFSPYISVIFVRLCEDSSTNRKNSRWTCHVTQLYQTWLSPKTPSRHSTETLQYLL